MKRSHILCAFVFLLAFLAGCNGKPAPEPPVSELMLDTSNAKTYFFSDDVFTADGLKITARFEDGGSKELSLDDVELEAPALAPYGDKEVTVSYGGASAGYAIHCALSTSDEDSAGRAYTLKRGVTLTAYVVGEGKPFVVICPGGGYTMVAESVEGHPYAEKLNELGYNAFVLKYTTSANSDGTPLLYQPLDDLALAMHFITENGDFFDLDTSDYAVCGSSAGGHLVATWSTKAIGYEKYGLPRPSAAFLCYAVVQISDGNTDSGRALLGNDPSAELLRSFSANENVDADYPPTYCWVFVEDDLAIHTELMERALEDAGVRHIARYFHGGAHGLGLAVGYEAEGWLEEAVAFWQNEI